MTKSCPNCGAPKHPLKICGECGFSALRQPDEARVKAVPAQATPKPKPQRDDGSNPESTRKRLRKGDDERVVDWWLDPTQQLDQHFLEDAHYDLMADLSLTDSFTLPAPQKPVDGSIASANKKARTWLEGSVTPQSPMVKLFDEIDLYEGWSCPGTRQYALELLQQDPEMNFQVLQYELRKASATVLEYPHIWWYSLDSKKRAALYKDANNLPFIRLNNAWHLGYSLVDVKGLACALTERTDQPVNTNRSGFFLCWENEDQARNNFEKSLLRTGETQEDD